MDISGRPLPDSTTDPQNRSRAGRLAWMTEYLTSTLCPALGIGQAFKEIALPVRGVKSTLLLVRPEADPPFVLRCIKGASSARALLGRTRFAQTENLPTARIRHTDTSRKHFRKHGFGIIVEELIEGTHRKAGEVGAEGIETLAGALAALHGVRAGRWGPPEKATARRWGRRGAAAFFDAMIVAKFKNRLASVSKFDPRFEREWKNRILDFVRSCGAAWDGGPPYRLTHDKINTGNVLFSPGGQVFFLDLISLRFGAPGKDLAAALYYFCKGEGEESGLKKAYFSHLGSGEEEHFTKFEPLYRAWHHLGRWAAKSRGAYKTKKKGGDLQGGETHLSRYDERDAMWAWIERGSGGSTSR